MLLKKVISVNGISTELSYSQIGKGSLIFIFHGLLHSNLRWMHTINFLSRQYTIIAVDLPGFGKTLPLLSKDMKISTYSKIIEEYILQVTKELTPLKKQPYAIIADSLSALIILDFIEHSKVYPNTTIIVGCPIFGLPPISVFLTIPYFIRNALLIIKLFKNKFMDSLIRFGSFITVYHSKKIDSIFYEDIRNSDPYTVEILLKQIYCYKIKLDFKLIEKKSMYYILRGEEDRMVSAKSAQWLAEQLNTRFISIPMSGHTPMMENKTFFNNLIASLMEDENLNEKQ